MPLKSDITIDTSAFDDNAISEQTHALNASLMEIQKKMPKWYEVQKPSTHPPTAAQLLTC
jgi:hypothetical protein